MFSRQLLFPILVGLMLLAGCGGEKPVAAEGGFAAGGCELWADSVVLSDGLSVEALDDSTLLVSWQGDPFRTITVGSVLPEGLIFRSEFPVLDLLFRLEREAIPLPARHPLLPFVLYLDPLGFDEADELLKSRLKNGYIVPGEARGFSWPIVNDNALWLLGATEIYCARGGNRRLEKLGEVAANSVEIDRSLAFNSSTRLFAGLPRYMISSQNSWFPQWMDATDLSGVQSLTVNVAYYNVLARLEQTTAYLATVNVRSRIPELPVSADSLKTDIVSAFWQPEQELMSGLLYGNWLWPVAIGATDNMGAALAVASGMTSPPMSRLIVGNRFAGVYSADRGAQWSVTEILSPGYQNESADNGELFRAVRSGMWIMAANESGNDEAVEWLLAKTLRRQVQSAYLPNSDIFSAHPLSVAMLRGVLGLRFAPSGLRFSPNVPTGLKGEKRFSNLRYRRAILDVTLSGTGSVLKSFRLDGKESVPRLPATLRGRHTVEIVMAEANPLVRQVENRYEANLLNGGLPSVPMVRWLTLLQGSLELQGSTDVSQGVMYINGVDEEILSGGPFSVEVDSLACCVQIALTDTDGLMGFSANPHIIYPKGSLKIFPAAEVALPGTHLVSGKNRQKQLVESHRYRNASIRLEFNAPVAGTYALSADYLSGLGIVNRRWRTAVRGVWVNGARVGTMLFTQNGSQPRMSGFNRSSDAEPAADDAWESMISTSRAVKITLPQGKSEVELRFVQPSPVFVDPTANTVLFSSFRIFRIE